MRYWGSRKKCYCAFCRSERMVYVKQRLNLMNFLLAFVLSGLTMAVVWQEINPKAVLFFIVYLVIGEIFVQVRWRFNVICKRCGFDPILYRRNPELAVVRVKAHLAEREKNPASLLMSPLDLPFQKKKEEEFPPLPQESPNKDKGKLLSRVIH